MKKLSDFIRNGSLKRAAPGKYNFLWRGAGTVAPTASGAGVGAAWNWNTGDTGDRWRGAFVGAGAGALAHAGGRKAVNFIGRDGNHWAVPYGSALVAAGGADPLITGFLANQRSETVLNNAQSKLLKDNAAMAGGKSTHQPNGNSQSSVSHGLGIPELIAVGALSAAGGYALYQLARANKRKADGKEPPATTNVTVAGGGGGQGPGGATSNAPPGSAGSAGTLKVTLPTRRAGDNESTVEMPLERIGLSNAILTKLRRDVKRRLRTESDARTHRLVPAPAAVEKLSHLLSKAD